jgi:hypothetical protein
MLGIVKKYLPLIASGSLVVAGAFVGPAPASAISVADVTLAMNEITTSANSTADVALPIGAAIIGMGILGGILYRFIGG